MQSIGGRYEEQKNKSTNKVLDKNAENFKREKKKKEKSDNGRSKWLLFSIRNKIFICLLYRFFL